MEAPKIFWSWQNDYAPKVCRYFVKEALIAATEAASEDLGLQDAERPEVDHDTQNAPGMVDIIATILKKISQSAVFVADVTPIGKTAKGKTLPNPNVLLELGWALSILGPDRIIAIINTASGFTPDDLPFDIRNRRALPYMLDEDAGQATRAAVKQSLISNLTYAITASLATHIELTAASQVVEGVPAKPDNPSIWGTATEQIESFLSGQKQLIAFPDCPRAYIRIIPATWKNGSPPSVHAISTMSDPRFAWSPLEGGGSGTFGNCEEGFVRYWYTGKTQDGFDETRNVTMFFDTTGEFWTVHGTAVDDYKYGPSLRDSAVLYLWANALKGALSVFKHFDASPICKVEAGLFGVRGVLWPGQWQSQSPPARKNFCVALRQSREWDDSAQLAFLTEAYAKVADLFGRPPVNAEGVRNLLENLA